MFYVVSDIDFLAMRETYIDGHYYFADAACQCAALRFIYIATGRQRGV